MTESRQRLALPPERQVPCLDNALTTSGNEGTIVIANLHRYRAVHVTSKYRPAFMGVRVPEPYRVIQTRYGQRLPVAGKGQPVAFLVVSLPCRVKLPGGVFPESDGAVCVRRREELSRRG